MGIKNEITKKGLDAMNKTVSLFENTHEIKLYLERNSGMKINKSPIKENKAQKIINPQELTIMQENKVSQKLENTRLPKTTDNFPSLFQNP